MLNVLNVSLNVRDVNCQKLEEGLDTTTALCLPWWCSLSEVLTWGLCQAGLQGRAELSLRVYRFHSKLQCSLSIHTDFSQDCLFQCVFPAAELLPFSSVPVQNLINEGFAVAQLVNQLHDTVVESEDYSDKQKSAIVEKLAVSLA